MRPLPFLLLSGALTLAAEAPAAGQVSIGLSDVNIRTNADGIAVAQMPPGTATLLGRATEAGTTRPVAGALVVLTLSGAAPLRVMADAQGQFAFRDLPPGRFAVTASRPGYADGAFGRQRPGGPTQTLALADNQHAIDVVVPLWKNAVITGRVVDEAGDPMVGATVRVLKRTNTAGKRSFVSGASTTTDDRGIYRLSGLDPAEYLVVVPMTLPTSLESMLASLGLPRDLPPMPAGGGGGAAVFNVRVSTNGGDTTVASGSLDNASAPYAGKTTDGRALTYATEFFPGAPSASRATAVTLASGEERPGVDFQIKPVRAVNVNGHVIAPGGAVTSGTSVTLLPADADDLLTPIETASARVDSDGAFHFSNVPTGQYVLHVQQLPRMAPGPGDTVVMYETGHFGMLWKNAATRFGLEVEFIPGDWRSGVDASAIETALRNDKEKKIKAVCVCHNETSTGCTSSMADVRKAMDALKHPALFMVDAVSSLGSIEFLQDKWGVDVTVAASQKGLMLPPGLSFNAVSDKALAAAKQSKLPKSFWSWDEMLGPNKNGFFPYTPSTNLLYGLREALAMLEEEGLDKVFARHDRHAEATRRAVRAWGLEIL